LYGFITSLRNYLYDKGILKSYSFDIPVIAVGNLSVGGTGKTPQIEYLIRLLSPNYKVATLSRGYKRKSEGFVLADASSTADILGDEPFQYYKKFPTIQVAVDADRRNGIEQLLNKSKPEIILLDDAFQHRKVKAGFYILLTAYGDLFCDDFILPTGNLRESRNGAKRANIIIVTKCPPNITELEQEKIREKLMRSFLRQDDNKKVEIYFSSIDYDDKVYNGDAESLSVNEIKSTPKILLAGIAKPKSFFDFLQADTDEIMTFPDHHHFSESEILSIKSRAVDKIIITTEKDFVRLKAKILKAQLYYLPIRSKFVSNQETFDQIILNYVGTCTGNR
jgi:tetraacyldisaccharide 4'-kinase